MGARAANPTRHRTPTTPLRLLAYLQFACVPWIAREVDSDGIATVRLSTHAVTRALSLKRARLDDYLTWLTRQGYLLVRTRVRGEAVVDVRLPTSWNAGGAVRPLRTSDQQGAT
jgi:hypothetical protein